MRKEKDKAPRQYIAVLFHSIKINKRNNSRLFKKKKKEKSDKMQAKIGTFGA